MPLWLKILVSLLLLAALTASPWLWAISPWWIALLLPLVAAWSVWLVVEYLRWARQLSKSRSAARGDPKSPPGP